MRRRPSATPAAHSTFDRLWEHAERIRSGELAELAPLLVLCEDEVTEELIQRERELIRGLAVPDRQRADLLALAVTVGSRFLPRELVMRVFQEELPMLKQASIVEEWIEEAAERASTKAHAEGRAAEARRMLLRLLQQPFGELPASVIQRVTQADADWCEARFDEALRAQSLADVALARD